MNNDHPTEPTSFLLQLNQLLEQNASDPDFGIEELCKLLYLSRSSLHRKVKTKSGKSTSIYVRDFRLTKAYQLLQTSNAPIKTIAFAVGFWDMAYFSKCFKDKFETTATEIKSGTIVY